MRGIKYDGDSAYIDVKDNTEGHRIGQRLKAQGYTYRFAVWHNGPLAIVVKSVKDAMDMKAVTEAIAETESQVDK